MNIGPYTPKMNKSKVAIFCKKKTNNSIMLINSVHIN